MASAALPAMHFGRASREPQRPRRRSAPQRYLRLGCESLEERRLLSAVPFETHGPLHVQQGSEPRAQIVTVGVTARVIGLSAGDADRRDAGTVFFRPDRLIVDFGGELNDEAGGALSALNLANWQLLRDGADVTGLIVDIGYEARTTGVGVARSQVVLSLSQTLGPGQYELIVRESIHSADGLPLDGDEDGQPGGDARRSLQVSELTASDDELVGRTLNGQAPAVAADASGSYVVAWIGQRTGAPDGDSLQVLAQRYTAAGETLGGVIVVAEGAGFENVALARAGDGQFVVAWDAGPDDDLTPRQVFARRFDNQGTAQGAAFEVGSANSWDPQVSFDAQGNFIIAFQQLPGIGLVQRYDAAGQPQGGPISIANARHLRAGMDAAGNLVVAWRDQDTTAIFVQIFTADGTPRTGRIAVSVAGVDATLPALAVNDSGEFVVAWRWPDLRKRDSGIMARRFDATGQPSGAGFLVDESRFVGDVTRPAVAIDAQGNFVVSWIVETTVFQPGPAPQPLTRTEGYARAFDATGQPLVDTFRVTRASEVDSGLFDNSAVGPGGLAFTPAGQLIATWRQGTLAPLLRPDEAIINPHGRFAGDFPSRAAYVQQFSLPDRSEADSTVVGRVTLLQTPTIAADAAGNYVIAWIGRPSDGSGDERLLVQRFDAAGAAVGNVIEVDTSGRSVSLARVVMSADGRFVIVWNSSNLAITGHSPLVSTSAQRFEADGTPLGDRFMLPSDVRDIAMNDAGELAVTYSPPDRFRQYLPPSQPQPPIKTFIARFDAAGVAQGDPILVGTNLFARIDLRDDGSIVAVWTDASRTVVAQMFAADGTPLDAPLRVSWLPGVASAANVEVDANGGFIVVWNQESGGEHHVFAQRFDAGANFLGSPLQVTESAEPRLATPTVTIDPAGGFYVTWSARPFSGLIVVEYSELFDRVTGELTVRRLERSAGQVVKSVRARAYDATGQAIGDPFSVGGDMASTGIDSSIVGASGELIVAWLNSNRPQEARVSRFEVARTPLVDLNGDAEGIDFAVNYQPDGPATSIVDGRLRIREATQLVSARVAIRLALAGDTLEANTAGTSIQANFAGGVLTLTGADSVANYEQVLGSVTFRSDASRAVGSNVEIEFTVDDGESQSPAATATVSIHQPGLSNVVDRHVFYNNSAFDGRDPAATAADDGAIAADKRALLPGEAAAFENVTNYTQGLNGIMIDLAGTHGQITLADFEFRVGNNNSPAGWSVAPPPAGLIVRPSAGAEGADRIVITWPDGAIQNAWLEVTLLANGNTGLAADDVFYFGNALGETGDSSFGSVRTGDIHRVINRLLTGGIGQPAQIDSPFDFDRSGRLSTRDVLVAINQLLSDSEPLLPIAPQLVAPAPAGLAGGGDVAALLNVRESARPRNVEQPAAAPELSASIAGAANDPYANPALTAAALVLWEADEIDSLAADPAEFVLPTQPAR